MADTPTLRERARSAARAEIAATAVRLFAEHGFEATTVDQIAAAVGISRRSFFHYFGSKEDVVLGDTDALGETVRAALEARPPEESAWTAIREAFKELRRHAGSEKEQLILAGIHDQAPSLRARHLEKHLRWQELLAPEIQRRLGLPRRGRRRLVPLGRNGRHRTPLHRRRRDPPQLSRTTPPPGWPAGGRPGQGWVSGRSQGGEFVRQIVQAE